jgi:hypothetical protein
MSETVNKDQPSAMQIYVNEFAAKSRNDGMHLKESKCKELRISFSTTNVEFEPIIRGVGSFKKFWGGQALRGTF